MLLSELTDRERNWIKTNFQRTKNDLIVDKYKISHTSLHRFARENGLKKSKQFMCKVQKEASELGKKRNRSNNWPPKGYSIPKSKENQFQKGVTPIQRLGKKKNEQRIKKSAESRRKTVEAEKRRILFGMPQKTKMKLVSGGHKKAAYRHVLKKKGYIVSRDSKDIFFNDQTQRSLIMEKSAFEKYRFTIKEYQQ